jgi:hypothetical protein
LQHETCILLTINTTWELLRQLVWGKPQPAAWLHRQLAMPPSYTHPAPEQRVAWEEGGGEDGGVDVEGDKMVQELGWFSVGA